VSLYPTENQINDLKAGNSNEKVVMLNLLVFKNLESYGEYGNRVKAILPDYSGKVLFSGAVRSVYIGDGVPKFEAVLLVEYANHNKFLEMTSSEAYLSFHHFREEGLESQWLLSLTPF
jgi:uncharacterized protein (DUF1330 family)